MMNGITILNTIPNYIYEFRWTPFTLFVAIVFSICVIICAIIIFDCFIQCNSKDASLFIYILMLLASTGILFTGIIGYTETEEIESYTYQVTIDDTVSFQEFNQKYEIISQKGQIFTIKERDN